MVRIPEGDVEDADPDCDARDDGSDASAGEIVQAEDVETIRGREDEGDDRAGGDPKEAPADDRGDLSQSAPRPKGTVRGGHARDSGAGRRRTERAM